MDAEAQARPPEHLLWTPKLRVEPGWTGWTVTGLLALWILDAYSVPGEDIGHIFFALPLVALLALAWVVRFAVAGGLRLRRGRPIAWRRFAVQPVLALLLAWALYASAPLTVRFELSRGAMESAARDSMSGKRDPGRIHRIGLFSVDRAERIPGGFRFLVSSTGFLDAAGFAYSPKGPPAVLGEDEYEHLSGPWYVWSESW